MTTTTTVHIGIGRLEPRSVGRRWAGRRSGIDAIGLAIVGVAVSVGSLAVAAITGGALLVVIGASPDAGLSGSGALLFALAVIAETAIWLIGAVRTRRTIRRIAPLLDRADRAACAELNALLVRE
jgi:hypothetical protein